MELPSPPSFGPPPPVGLSIAGFDPSSGAGITADLLVFQAHGVFGTSAITALTVQSTLGVSAVHPLSGTLISETLKSLHSDLPPAGIKIGMLGSSEAVSAVSQHLSELTSKTDSKPFIPIVLDPILKASSGAELLDPAALDLLCRHLLPLVGWITPNWSELAQLTDQPVTSTAQAQSAASLLCRTYPTLGVIVTGGDQDTPADLFCPPEGPAQLLPGEHIETTSTHGTGCAFSTAFLANLIQGKTALDAALSAKSYVAQALRLAPGLGHGRGPLNLLWPLTHQSQP